MRFPTFHLQNLQCWGGAPPSQWGATFCVYPSDPVIGCQLNDFDTTSWYADRAKAAARGVSKSKDFPVAARPAVPEDRLRHSVGTSSLREEFTFLAVAGWISLLRVTSEAIPTMGVGGAG